MDKYTSEQIVSIIDTYKKTHGSPFFIEIAGSPNSGKTSAIKVLEKLLKRSNISHYVIYESADICDIKSKLSENFNIWTACDTICKILATLDKDYDIIICERGVFDALCWCKFHLARNRISDKDFKTFTDFYSSSKFTDKVSLLMIFKCTENTSIEREAPLHISTMEGTIINKPVLSQINHSISETKKLFIHHFKNVIEVDTTKYSQEEINKSFVDSIFTKLKTN